jgi:hypothetical protein
MNQDINYALISALYNSKTGGLYSDVYFPIIKYTIVQLFNQKVETDSVHYFTAVDVHDFIQKKFRIHIPSIVIAKSLQKIERVKKDFIDLTVMEGGNSFEVRKIWDSKEFDELSEREALFSVGLNQIEADYKYFLEQHGTYDDGVGFLQFISDNTEEVLSYFQNNDAKLIDERYTTIIFFLEYLHNTPSRKEEFYIADQLFWASIIAGYLRSEKPPVDAAEDGSSKEYFLDTSILMGMLKLSSKQKEAYTLELKEIIKASGGVMRAHPMTLEEIKTILVSVESAARPDPGTDIAEAWENHDLTINKLAKIRLTLPSLLQQHGVQVFPQVGADECKAKARSYNGKRIVAELAAERSKKPKSYSQDNFREIHDLFMDDYIKERRKAKNGSDDIVFVTSNRDLIEFTKYRHPNHCYMISTGRVVLDLWMHNVKPAEISSCALTETMARCLDQHNIRVRNKLIEVSKFFNENKGNFDAQVYQDFVRKLYQRAKNVILTVETDPDDQDTLGPLTVQRIVDAVKADQEFYNKKLAEKEEENSELSNKLSGESQSKVILVKTNKAQKEHIENLKKEKADLEGSVYKVKEKLSRTKEEAAKEKSGRIEAEERVALYERRDMLRNKLERLISEMAPWEIERKSSFRNYSPKLLFLIGVFLIIVAVFIIGYAIVKGPHWIIAAATVPSALGIFSWSRSGTLNDREEERRSKAYEKWEGKEENKRYKILAEEISSTKLQLKEIEKLL